MMMNETDHPLTGVANDIELDESVAALRRAMADVQAGRTRAASDFLAELVGHHAALKDVHSLDEDVASRVKS